MSKLRNLLAGVLMLGLWAADAPAAVIHLDPSVDPEYFDGTTRFVLKDFNGENAFHGVRFVDTSIDSDGQQLVMSTAYGQGVWFGNLPGAWGSEYLNWSINPNSIGTDFSVTAYMGSGGSQWTAYMYDGTYYAEFNWMSPTSLHLAVAGGYTEVTLALPDPSPTAEDYTTIRWLLKDGLVAYWINGDLVYAGGAMAISSSPYILVGDPSGSTISGTGGWQVASLSMDLNPTQNVPVPEPATAGLMLGLAAALRRNRRK